METRLLLALHALTSPALDAAFVFSDALGTFRVCGPICLGVALALRLRGERRAALIWILVGLSTVALFHGLKPIFARPRPALWTPLVPASGWALPSGHAVASATFYPLLGWTLGRGRSVLRTALVVLGACVAVYVGLGRLYLGVHWPSDVLAGWAIGAVQCALAVRGMRSA